MQNRFDKIEEKIDRLDGRLDSVDKHLAVYNSQLEYHIARTNALQSKLEPVETHVKVVNAITMTVTAVGTILFALYQMGILQKFFGRQ